MALISRSIPNLINGVSQQPATMRLASQAELQINGLSSLVDGLLKRPPFEFVAKLMDNAPEDAFVHLINRDAFEKYVVIIADGDLKVFDFNGNEKTVTFPQGKDYLTLTSSQKGFSALTVADYTFILNKEKVTAMQEAVVNPRPKEGLVHIRQGNYALNYKIKIDGVVQASKTTSDTDPSDIKTDTIANDLYNQLVANLGTTDWTIELHGNVIYIKSETDTDFELTIEDSFGDQAMGVVKDSVQRFDELPNTAIPGFVVEIAGDQTSNFDNYYVEWESQGVWLETVKPGLQNSFDATTMPWALVRQADGTFEFSTISWEDREVGDDDSAPWPSFIGQKITDLFFHRNRLGFISDENIIFSEAGNYFQFWPTTVTTILDSGRIDISVSHVKVSILRHAIPFNEDLLLFSDQTQFVLRGSDILTPNTASIAQTTEFENSRDVRPVGAGTSIFFVVPRGKFSGIREYFVEQDTDNNDADDTTSHVPRYVPGNIVKMTSSSNEDILLCLSADEKNALYAYKWYDSNRQRLQSSWSKWTIHPSGEFLDVEIVESQVFAVVRRSDGLYLEAQKLQAGYRDEDVGYLVLLDQKVRATGVYDEQTKVTTWTLPYTVENDLQGILTEDFAGRKGQSIALTTYGSNEVTAIGDFSDGQVIFGVPYEHRYRFSPPVIKEQAPGGGQVAVGIAKVKLRRWHVTYSNTGYFRAEVTPKGGATYSYPFTGRILGSAENVLGEVPMESGVFTFPIKASADAVEIDLVNDSPLPSAFLSAEWEAMFTILSRRT